MKKIVLLLLTVLFFISGCNIVTKKEYIAKTIETNLKNCTIESQEDTHGGFLGDGEYFAKIKCTNIDDNEISLWNKLPISDEIISVLDMKMCSKKTCDNVFERYNIPDIKDGYYYFYDRHTDATNRKDDTNINKRSSYNFSFAIYDIDNKIIYYYELDT